MESIICLRTKPNRNGNSKRVYICLQGNHITGVTDSAIGRGGSRSALEVKVAPSEINELLTQAKKAGLYK
ncbi:MAG TPA: hypothetical protein VHQ01_04725 [Pyrinomonadaceae bacterium]|nr:hypothetical protein [Pyrinomonadaceae bacterium]